MTGLDHTRRRDRRDRHDGHRRRPERRRRGSRPRRAPSRRRAGADGPVRRRDAHPVRAARARSARRRSRSRRPGAQTLAFIKEHVPSRARSRCAATRSAPTAGSSPPTCPRSRSTCTTARSTCRRIKELVRRWYPDVLARRAREGRSAPRPRRHPREPRSRSCGCTASWCSPARQVRERLAAKNAVATDQLAEG